MKVRNNKSICGLPTGDLLKSSGSKQPSPKLPYHFVSTRYTNGFRADVRVGGCGVRGPETVMVAPHSGRG